MFPKFEGGQAHMKTWVFFASLVLAQALYKTDKLRLPLVDTVAEYLTPKA